jgi:hypothetical protein
MSKISLKIILIILFACGMCQIKPIGFDEQDIIILLKPTQGEPYKVNKPVKMKLFIKFKNLGKGKKYFCELTQDEKSKGSCDYIKGEFQDNQIYTKTITYTPTSLGTHKLKITLKDDKDIVKIAVFPFEVFKESSKHKIEFDALDNKILPDKVGVFTLNISNAINSIKGAEAAIYKFKEYTIVGTIGEVSGGTAHGKLSKSKDIVNEFIQGDELYAGTQKLYYHTLSDPAGKYKLFIKLEDTEGIEHQASLDFELLDVNYIIVGTSDKKGNIRLEIKEAPDELHNKTWTVVSYNFSEGIIGTLHEENLDLKYGINNLHFSLSKIDIPTGLVLTLNVKGPEDKIKPINVDISESIYLYINKLLDDYEKDMANLNTGLNKLYSKAEKLLSYGRFFFWLENEQKIRAAKGFIYKKETDELKKKVSAFFGNKEYANIRKKLEVLADLNLTHYKVLNQKLENIQPELLNLHIRLDMIFYALAEQNKFLEELKKKNDAKPE